MHAQLDALRGAARYPEQLDAVAQFLGIADVLLGELGDALGVGLLELHRDAEGDRRHDGELVRRIHALDVESGVGLGVAQALRFLQHRVERQALVAHFRQNEIRGAVDDAGDPLDAIGREPLAQRLDDGNAARHRGLEAHHHAFFLRRCKNLVAVRGQQRLVGGDHVLAVRDGLQNEFLGDGIAADQFDHDIDVRVRDHAVGIGGQARLAAGDFLRPCLVLVRHRGDHDAAAGAAGDFLLVARQHVPGAAAHGANAQQAHVDRFHFSHPVLWRLR